MSTESEKKKGVLGARSFKKLKNSNVESNDPMFVGMDPSFNGFAIIILDKHANIIEQKLINSKSDNDIEDRLIDLESEYKFIPNIIGLHSVYMEGPSFGSNGAFVLQMGALHYMLRIMLKRNGVNYKIIAPGTLKKFVTGDGRSKKELMLMKTYKKWAIEFTDNNLADAYGLARMALDDYINK